MKLAMNAMISFIVNIICLFKAYDLFNQFKMRMNIYIYLSLYNVFLNTLLIFLYWHVVDMN